MPEKRILSKIFSKEIQLPEGVGASLAETGSTLSLKKGSNEISRKLNIREDCIKIENGRITVSVKKATKGTKKKIGSEVAHIKNMIKGITDGHRYVLKICSGHFPMNVSVSGSRLAIKNFLGEKVPRELEIKKGADVKVEGEIIIVESSNKEIAGQVSAAIEQLTRRPGFDTRVFQDGIYLVNKDGKELK